MNKFWEETVAFLEAYGETLVTIFACILAVVLLVIAFVNHKKGKFTSKMITNGAITIALAMILNLLPVFSMPNGGSVTIARLLPLLVFAYIYGFGRGCLIGALYGLLDFMMKPYFLNVVQFLLDYPLAFAGVGFVGLSFFKNKKYRNLSFILGAVITGLSRWLFSTVSGTLYWGLTFFPSLVYNSVLLIDTAVCLVVMVALLQSKSFVRLMDDQRQLTRKDKTDNV